jgi:alpha-N-arabinofuranosidase
MRPATHEGRHGGAPSAVWWLVLMLASVPVSARAQTAGGPLRNGGFEADSLEDWEVVRYGAPSRVGLDPQIRHEGRQSLRISASEASDTAPAQELSLKPNGWYRLRGWVRTEGLDPRGAPTFGTIQVQKPQGAATLAAGPNHGGDSDWAEVVIPFRAPADGRVRIALFFVGFGRGTGTAWFDGLRLDESDPTKTPLVITREPLGTGTINPMQYGQFVEYLCNLVPSMWAEKLDDGSFEGSLPYKLAHLKETDFRENLWYPTAQTNRANYQLDRTTNVSGDVSKRIASEGDTPCTVGIAQDGIALTRGVACTLSCFLKQTGLKGPVQFRLHRDATVYASCELRPNGSWKKFHARLNPTESVGDATLTITFRGPGTLWLDNVSLMPEDAVGGWRKDVVEATRALRPAIIRFGGSALDDSNLGEFDWRSTIGDPDKRRPFRAWGGLQPAAAGLEEIVQFCRLVDAEPLLCVRTSKKGPDEAVAQLQYFNAPADTPMGAWRARNGHPEPYRVKYWQIGNERAGTDYDRQLGEFARAMKQADPAIELMSSYPTVGALRAAGPLLDYVCPHHYGCHHLAAMAADFASIRRLLHTEAPGRNIRVAVTEWNTTAGDAGPHRAMLWTLANALACARYHNLCHRNADLVTITNRSNLINSFCSGIIQVDNRRLYKTPTYYAQQLYATRAGTRPLVIRSDWPSDDSPDLSATLTADGTAVVLLAVNDATSDLTRPLDFSAFGTRGQECDVWTLADRDRAGEPDVSNDFAGPERVCVVQRTLRADSPQFQYRFPALSLTAIRWPVAQTKP